MKKSICGLLILLAFAPIEIVAQDVATMLNTIAYVFSTRQEALYDEAEDYLNSLSKDSIEINLETEILFHANKASLYATKYNERLPAKIPVRIGFQNFLSLEIWL